MPQLSLGLEPPAYAILMVTVPDKVIRYYQRISIAIENKSQVQMEQEGGRNSAFYTEREAYARLKERSIKVNRKMCGKAGVHHNSKG